MMNKLMVDKVTAWKDESPKEDFSTDSLDSIIPCYLRHAKKGGETDG